MNKRIEYAKFQDFLKNVESKDETELEGVFNYKLKSVYAPVLDRKFIDSFNTEKTCISVCGNKAFEFDEDKLIANVLDEVKNLKKYHLSNPHGKYEHIGEYSIFQNIDIEGFMLKSYTFERDENNEYYLILWFTPTYLFNGVRKHVFWYNKKNNMEWY